MGVCSSVVDVSPTITSKCRKNSRQYYPAGCNYSVPEIDKHETATQTTLRAGKLLDTLWIGASSTFGYKYPEINTLVRFYTIYVPDLDVWATLDYVEDHKEELIALETTLSLCLYSYNTTTTYGVTNTKQVGKLVDLDWQTGTGLQPDGKTSFDTAKTTHDTETFWMSKLNVDSFNKYLAIQIFSGYARYRPATVDGGGNTTSSDAVRVVADSIYGSPPGLQGLSVIMDNLAVSMTNGCAFPKTLLLHDSGLLTARAG